MGFRKKRNFRKKTFSKKNFRRRRVSKSRVKTGMFKLKCTVPSSTTAGGALRVQIRLTEPLNVDSNAAAVTDWASVANLYDTARVCAVKVQWFPAHPFDPSSAAGYRPVYCVTDFDQTGLTLTNADAVGYENLKVKNIFRPFTYYIKVPKMTNPTSTSVAQLGYFDTTTPFATGSIYLTCDSSLTASSVYGQIMVTYYIKAINRR